MRSLSPLAVRGTALRALVHFELPIEATARARCALQLYTSTRGCKGARRGAQAWACPLAMRVLCVRYRTPTASAGGLSVGACRREERGTRRWVAVEVVCGPLRAPASPQPRTPRGSHTFPPVASACACARAAVRFQFGCAARRSGTRSSSGRPRRRRAAAARRWRRIGHCTRHRVAAWTCAQDGGGNSAYPLNGRFAASGNGAPEVVLGVHVGVGIDERSDDLAIAVERRNVQRGVANAVHGGPGCGGGPHGGTPVPNRYPKTKQQARPEGRLFVRFGETLTLKRGLGIVAISRAHQNVQKLKSRETAIAGDGGGENL
jgi:hypothetical protein